MKRWLAVALLSGCALTGKGTPLELRYFSPEAEHAGARPSPRRVVETIQLGRITSSPNLRSRIVHRESAVEVGLYETLRWTDNPEVYVRRALAHELFDDGAFGHAVGGTPPTLDVDVVAFEEVKMTGRHSGRVVLRYELHDERLVLASGVVAGERPATGEGFDAVVAALGGALDDAAAQLAAVAGKRLAPESSAAAR